MTRLHFFLHDALSGENPSAIMIDRPNIKQASSFGFSSLFAIDWKRSRALCIIHGRFNGSSFSLFLRNSSSDIVRELAIVGKRGAFRMARGFALTQLNFVNMTTGNVVLECN
ncbi:hypothetical protein Gogos_020371, partial [Gossypium gossypioides]|nr:hypothetical protein [Gossypium gossypioides]